MRRIALSLLLACGCASGTSVRPSATAAPSVRSPYDAAPAAAHAIEVATDDRAARDILASLSRQRFDPSDPKVLQDLPAVRLAIADSGRPPEVFERDFAAAYDETARASVFSFRTVRQEKDRWQVLLEAVRSRQSELARLASRRAAALLPGDRPIADRLQVFFTFGIAGLADHLVVAAANGREAMIVDLARALGESQADPFESQFQRLARLVAGEAFRQAWVAYREGSPVWKSPDPSLAQLDVLLRAVAETGPVALFGVDENFFPLSVWLKEPMHRLVGEMNRTADKLGEAKENLEARMELTTEIRRGTFGGRVAGPAGAFLCDAIVQAEGIAGLRAALGKGPKAFFQAYDRAAQKDRELVPLSHAIREKLK